MTQLQLILDAGFLFTMNIYLRWQSVAQVTCDGQLQVQAFVSHNRAPGQLLVTPDGSTI